MIGLDTNVVLRLFDRSNERQTAESERIVAAEGEGGCLINPIVLTELVWTLARAYKIDRAAIADHLDRILEAPEFVVPFHAEASLAARSYRSGPADFADYFLAAVNASLGCATTVTFDAAAARNQTFTLLTA